VKTLVIYDSQFGNTQKIAEAIGRGVSEAAGEGNPVQLHRLGDVLPGDVTGLDLLLVGSPTHAFRATPEMKTWLKEIPDHGLQETAVATFDTRFTDEYIKSESRVLTVMSGLFGFAADPMGDELKKKGGRLVVAPEGFYVGGTEGPLLAGELERAVEWGRQVVAAAV
jgi:flavodoxin